MSLLEFDRLVRDWSANQGLLDNMRAATTCAQAAEIARSAGYDVTGDEVEAYVATQRAAKTEFTAKELDAVSAGQPQVAMGAAPDWGQNGPVLQISGVWAV